MHLLGRQYRPALADLPDQKLWRIGAPDGYHTLAVAARGKVNLERIRRHWPDILRVVASIHTGAVRAYDVLRVLQGAATSEPAAAAMLAEFDERRLDAASHYARAAAATGQLAVSEQECGDLLAATMDGALWHRLVEERGWSDDRYAQLLGTMWVARFRSLFGLLGDGDIAVGATGAQQSSMMLRLSTVEAMGCGAKCAP